MTEPTEAAEAHRLITEAFADHEAEMQAEVGRVLDVVHQAAAAFAAGDMDTAGTLLVTYTSHSEDQNEDEAAYTLVLAAVSGLGFILDGDLIEPPCEDGGTHGALVDTAVHAANLASARDDENLSRTLGALWDERRDAVFPLAAALITLLAGVLVSVAEDGDRDA